MAKGLFCTGRQGLAMTPQSSPAMLFSRLRRNRTMTSNGSEVTSSLTRRSVPCSATMFLLTLPPPLPHLLHLLSVMLLFLAPLLRNSFLLLLLRSVAVCSIQITWASEHHIILGGQGVIV